MVIVLLFPVMVGTCSDLAPAQPERRKSEASRMGREGLCMVDLYRVCYLHGQYVEISSTLQHKICQIIGCGGGEVYGDGCILVKMLV